MNVLQLLHFFSFIAFCYLAVYSGLQNRKALINRLCVILFFCFAIWSFSQVWMHSPISSIETVRIWGNIGAVGWCTFSSFYLCFILAFTKRTAFFRKWWFYLIIAGIPLLLLYKQWTNLIIIDYVPLWFGWRGKMSFSIWPFVFFIYYLSTMFIGFYLNGLFLKESRHPVLKRQVRIILISSIVSVVLGTGTDVFCTMLNIQKVPDMADVTALIWGMGVVYAIGRYKFLTVTPITAADNIISTMFECLLLLNLDGEIVKVNQATQATSGYSAEELEGKSIHSFLRPVEINSDEATEIPFQKQIAEGIIKNRELAMLAKHGKEIPVLFSSSLLLNEAGNTAGIVCVAKDISDRKALEREHFQSKKLESVGTLARSLAHDFDNLLSHILGEIMLARQDLNSADPSNKLLLNAEEAIRRALDLAVKFNTFSPSGQLEKEKMSIARLLENIHPTCLPNFSVTVNLPFSYEVHLTEGLRPIYGDEPQLLLVLEHIFCNALEAIPAGTAGQIVVQAENETVAMDIKEGSRFLLKKGNYVKLSITDNGSGIPMENIEKVFDPYFSTKLKTSQKGVGLGLTICYAIVKKHGGHITLTSQPGKGTTVAIYLPAV